MRATSALRGAARYIPATALLVVATAVPTAVAHEIVPGVRGFASLVLHPFVAVDMVLVMVGLALVVGAAERRPSAAAGLAGIVLGASVGAAMQGWAVAVPGLWRAPLLLALALGALGASGSALRPAALQAIGFAASFAIGLGIPPEQRGWPGSAEVAAAASAAMTAVLLAVALPRAAFGRYAAVHIAGRVAGAWCLAIAGLGLAVAWR